MPADPAAWERVTGAAGVLGRTDREVLLGEDGEHLSFRVSVLVDTAARRVTLSTAVRLHDRAGRRYWSLVRRPHAVAARLLLRRTHRRLALAAPRAGERAHGSGVRLTS